ncbi:MAG: potassium-transporting ATPase subunit KdpA [Enterobacter hormaechei]
MPLTSLEGGRELLPMGPVASQEAIKMLGTTAAGSSTPIIASV